MRLAREFGLTQEQAKVAFGAVRAVVEADGAPRPNGVRLLELTALELGLGDRWQTLPTATPVEVAAAFPLPSGPKIRVTPGHNARRVLSDALLIPACIEGEVTVAGEASVKAFAKGLGVSSPWVRLLPAIRKRRTFAIKRVLVSNSPDGKRLFSRIWSEEGLMGVFRALQFMAGVYRNPALAAKFRALATLPPDTLGRTFFDSIDSKGFSFPGEKDGIPERMIHHDLMHVINGYGTDGAGECELAGFYAGFTPGEPFTFIAVVLTTFHLGLAVSPAAVTPTRGAFDPAKVLAAFLRGRKLKVDVMGPWDYWALMPLPVASAQEALGIRSDPAPTAVATPQTKRAIAAE